MAKYSKKKKKNGGKIVLLIMLMALLAALIWAAVQLGRSDVPLLEEGTVPTTTAQPENAQNIQTQPQVTKPDPLELSDGMRILSVSKYTGMYMEDGTNEIVSDVMMIILENTGEKDLQLARIYITYVDAVAEFEVTNLPAGEKAVLLEKNRLAMKTEEPQAVETRNVVFVQEPMQLREDQIQIAGTNGSLEVTNITDRDIAGDIYIYYKNSASDLLYGGITYRASVKGGLKAGESVRIIAGHYSPDTCRIMMVDGAVWGS